MPCTGSEGARHELFSQYGRDCPDHPDDRAGASRRAHDHAGAEPSRLRGRRHPKNCRQGLRKDLPRGAKPRPRGRGHRARIRHPDRQQACVRHTRGAHCGRVRRGPCPHCRGNGPRRARGRRELYRRLFRACAEGLYERRPQPYFLHPRGARAHRARVRERERRLDARRHQYGRRGGDGPRHQKVRRAHRRYGRTRVLQARRFLQRGGG